MDNRHETINRLMQAEAGLIYTLHCFGDHIAKREQYKAHTGIDAVHFYLIQKHGWTPQAVRGMNPLDLRFVLEEEMSGWTLPQEARP